MSQHVENRMANIIALILTEQTNTIITHIERTTNKNVFRIKDDQGFTYDITIDLVVQDPWEPTTTK